MPNNFLLSDNAIAALKRVHERAMDYTCTIERPISIGEDEHGQPSEPVWNTIASDLKCLLIQKISVTTGEQQQNGALPAVSRYTLYVPVGTNVEITDRIESILDRDGLVVDPTVKHYEILEKAPDYTAIALTLKAIR